jgi:hypothetical protein
MYMKLFNRRHASLSAQLHTRINTATANVCRAANQFL